MWGKADMAQPFEHATRPKVLITGGGGFIGAWIAKVLIDEGYPIRIFDLVDDRRILRQIAGTVTADRMDWRTGDIADGGAVKEAADGCGAIVHLAGLLTPACRADPLRGVSVNLVGTLNVFLAARELAIPRVIYMSSAGVFGPDGSGSPLPITHYGAFKLACEHSAAAFWHDDGIASLGLRPFVVYGPGREGGLSAGPTLACRAAARGQSYTIPFTGDFDMIHVEDVARAFAIALNLEPKGAQVLNLQGDHADASDVVRLISASVPGARIDAAGPPMPIACPKRDDMARTVLSGWNPRDLQTGLVDTIAFYRDHPDA